MKKKTLALIMAAAMVMGLAACGSSNSTTTTEDTTTEAADTAETETADAAETEDTTAEATEETADAAASDKVWVVATDTAFKPFEYTDDNGEAIKSDYDLYVAVNPASSDASGKIVGLKSGNTVTSSKNEVEAVSIKVTQDGTTYTAEYGIGTEKKIQEFNPGDDLTLLVQSSDLKDATDTNAITLSIENSTDKTLYVKVADDATAARVKITNKAGNVVVYK